MIVWLFVSVCYKIVDVEFLSVLIPVIIDTAGLADDNVADDSVNLGERKSLVIGDLTAVAFKYKSCSETFLLERVLVFADL
jgi:hypothetical protein